MNSQISLETFDSPATLVESVVEKLAAKSRECIVHKRRFTLALSGGSTPKFLYERMASPDWKSRFDWQNMEIFFGDERAVPADDALSNFKMASEALLSHVPVKAHRIETEFGALEAAHRYEEKLRTLGAPLDVVLLGLGEDGHTASLFPHSPALSETQKLVSATPVATLAPFVERITLTFPAINSSENKWFLVTGAAKRARLHEVLNGGKNTEILPAQGVEGATWFVDKAAL